MKLKLRTSISSVLLPAALTLVLSVFGLATPSARADTILFDRGLPTTNLNNAAGADRSNVAWGEPASGEASPPTASIGENFTLSQGATIDSLTVWVIDNSATAPSAFQLWLGADASPGAGSTASVSEIATSPTSVTSVTYSGGSTYQGTSGNFSNIYEVEFSGLGLTESAGTYAFSVSGDTETGMLTPFLSASNAALGGAYQIAGDGYVYAFDSSGDMDTANGYPWGDIAGWDKTSDIDVVVAGTPVPEPASLSLFGVALIGLWGFTWARRRKAT
jgi:hypothetical protein